MVWSFFGSGHGKGVHDGAGAVLKQEIRKQQLNMDSPRMQNAADVVAFCKKKQTEEHAAYPNVRREVIRFFHLVKTEEVDRRSSWDCKRIPGSRSMHSISSVSHCDVTLLNMRELACFCPECMDDNHDFCENKIHVQPWTLVRLEPLNINQVSAQNLLECLFSVYMLSYF